MLIDATHAEETRVVVVDGNKVEEFDFESLNRRQLAGNIYLAKVTRVEPSLQAAFVEYGGNRHGFLAFSEIHPDYYQIPKADREALLREEAEFARAEDEAVREPRARSRSRSRPRPQALAEGAPAGEDDVVTRELAVEDIADAVEADVLDAAPAESLEDVPPPSAAGGDIEIDVAAEPAPDADGAAGPEAVAEAEPAEAGPQVAAGERHQDDPEYEAVGGDDVAEERQRPRKPRQRRYKIQEVIKVRQILLVQVVKEERGNKGAALTTYLSLAGRYCVLMPNTARGGGISRKITNAADRKKLKEISASIIVPEGAGLIIRTAGANRTKTEIKRDYEYLLRQWEQVRDLTLSSIAPCLIYEEGSLIKRVIRDLYSRDIEEVLVDGERGYREAKDYMKMLMPSHAKNVKHYADPLPLFSRFQVESYLAAMFNPVVQLKSGGYIVIDVTEALVAIDVNSGRATREASIEDTALKTNLEAAEEAARQMRLRDLAGLIVIDFIDMEERRNNAAVEKKLKDKLKTDRARLQVGRISGFGLLEMSRQRLRPGMIEATTKSCPHCHGTGRVRSDDSIALALLRELEEEGVRQRSKEVLIVAPVEIANYLHNQKREHIALIEGRFGLSVRIEGDPSLISPDYRVERFKTASRIVQVREGMLPVVVAYPEDDAVEAEDEIEEEAEEAAVATPEAQDEAGAEGGEGNGRNGSKRKRRRRRRGGPRTGTEADAAGEESEDEAGVPDGADEVEDTPAEAVEAGADAEAVPAPVAEEAERTERPKSRRRSRSRKEPVEAASEGPALSPFGELIEPAAPTDAEADRAPEIVAVPETDAPKPKRRERVRKPAAAVIEAPVESPAPVAETPEVETPEVETPVATTPVAEEPPVVEEAEPEAAEVAEADAAPEVAVAPEAAPEPAFDTPAEAWAPEATPEADAAPEIAPDFEPVVAEEPAPAPEPAPEPAPAELETAGGAQQAPVDEAPKRRGWWSRAEG